MAKIKYKFNPHTLKFDVISHPFRKKIAKIAIHLFVNLTLAATLVYIYSTFLDTPKEKNIKRDIANTILKYDLFQRKINEKVLLVREFQKRDNNIYRTIFEADTIPSSLKEGGYGGVNRYKSFEKYKHSDLLIKTFTMFDQLSWQVYLQSKSFDEVIDLARNKEKMTYCIPAIQPISQKSISAYFGFRADPFTHRATMHYGIDFTGDIGTPIHATGEGIVVDAEFSFTGYGKEVLIDHGFGYKTRYAHLSKIDVKSGDKVKRGQVVGLLGNTGRSTGPHLHYEVLLRNSAIDPLNYFNDLTIEDYDKMVKFATVGKTERDSLNQD
ncbi:MAG: M23 family metallopeptidase [Bacteroidales bacterium]|nr:MAG: M23 family metallopeptidase [Bacteroidales bacterium]